MQHPDEGTIHAWLDGALPAEEGAEVEAHVAACPACAAAVADARGLVAGASRILAALDDAPRGVIPAAGAPRSGSADRATARGAGAPRRRGWLHSPALRIAAAVALVAAGVATIGQLPRLDEGRALRAPREVARDAAASAREEGAAPTVSAPALPPLAQGAGESAAGPGAEQPPRGAAAKAAPLAATAPSAASGAGAPPASQGTIGTVDERHRDVASGIGTTPPPPTPGREGTLGGAAVADRSVAERSIAERRELASRDDARREAASRDAARSEGERRAVAAFSARAAAETTARAPADVAAVAPAAPQPEPSPALRAGERAALRETATTGVATDRTAAAADSIAAREKARIAAEPRRQRTMAGAVEGRVSAEGAVAVGPLAGCYVVAAQPEGEPIPSPFALDSAVAVAGDAVGWRVRWLTATVGGDEVRAIWAPMDDAHVRITWPLSAAARPPVVVAIEGREGVGAATPAGQRSATARRVECP